MKIKLLIISIILCVGCKTQNSTTTDNDNKKVMKITHDISMYTESTDGQLRHIITLPETKKDADYKVELYVGKTTEVDCNKSTLSGTFTKETVSGWGYSYFNFNTKGHIISTQMACPENSKHQEFVKSASEMIRYNSKLPIVVYTPKGYEVRYKIWTRNDNEQTASVK